MLSRVTLELVLVSPWVVTLNNSKDLAKVFSDASSLESIIASILLFTSALESFSSSDLDNFKLCSIKSKSSAPKSVFSLSLEVTLTDSTSASPKSSLNHESRLLSSDELAFKVFFDAFTSDFKVASIAVLINSFNLVSSKFSMELKSSFERFKSEFFKFSVSNELDCKLSALLALELIKLELLCTILSTNTIF